MRALGRWISNRPYIWGPAAVLAIAASTFLFRPKPPQQTLETTTTLSTSSTSTSTTIPQTTQKDQPEYAKNGKDLEELADQAQTEDKEDPLDPDIRSKAISAIQNIASAKYKEGIRIANEVLELKPDLLDVRAARANAFYHTGRASHAISELKKIITNDNKQFMAHFHLMYFLTERRQIDEAASYLDHTIKIANTDTQKSLAYALAAEVKMHEGNNPKTREYIKKSLNFRPGNKWAMDLKENLELRTGEFDDVDTDPSVQVDKDKKNLEELTKASICIVQERYDAAEGLLKTIIRRDSKYHLAYSKLSFVFFKQEKFKEAEHVIEGYLDLKPDDPDAYLHLGKILFAQEYFSVAISKLEEGLTKKCSDYTKSEFHSAIARNAYELVVDGKKEYFDKIEANYKKSLELNTHNVDARLQYGNFLKDEDRNKEAEKILEPVKHLQQDTQAPVFR
tara:strand:+ start:6343 stop:7695 length:1353 start_codon:yes stop_codon:yes gene_type:complete